MKIVFHLLGNDVSSTKNWKRKPPKSPVPKTQMYPKTVSSKQCKSVCSSSELNTTEQINHMASVEPAAVFTLENIAAARKAITICKLM